MARYWFILMKPKLNWIQRQLHGALEGLEIWKQLERFMQAQIKSLLVNQINGFLRENPVVVNMSVDLISPEYTIVKNRHSRCWDLDTGRVTEIVEQ